MSRLINSTTMTLDGVTDVGDWFVSEGGHDRAGRDQFVGAAGMLLGRTTYEGLAAYWSQQSGEWADMLNPLPKFVASRTLQGPLAWNATAIEGDAADGVSRLKSELEGDLLLIGLRRAGAPPACERPCRRAPLLGPSQHLGRGHAAVPGRHRQDAPPRVDVVRFGSHLAALRAAGGG